MSYDPDEYNGFESEREEREAWEREQEAREERLGAFHAGLCSHSAAVEGGEAYLRELAETAMELKEAGCAIPTPVAAASVARTSAELAGKRSAA
jgi:hypothetical protein